MSKYYLLHGCSAAFLEKWELFDFCWKHQEGKDWIECEFKFPDGPKGCFAQGGFPPLREPHYLTQVQEGEMRVLGTLTIVESSLNMMYQECVGSIAAQLGNYPKDGTIASID